MTKKRIYYDKSLTKKARYLRKNSTLSEVILWNKLKRNQFRGYDFHRQKPILHWIVDFFSYDLMLVIEVDGNYHYYEENRVKDKLRQERIESLGISFLRFSNDIIMHDINRALAEIHNYIDNFESRNNITSTR